MEAADPDTSSFEIFESQVKAASNSEMKVAAFKELQAEGPRVPVVLHFELARLRVWFSCTVERWDSRHIWHEKARLPNYSVIWH